MVNEYVKPQLGKDPKDLRVAIIHADGAYGTDVAKGNVLFAEILSLIARLRAPPVLA